SPTTAKAGLVYRFEVFVSSGRAWQDPLRPVWYVAAPHTRGGFPMASQIPSSYKKMKTSQRAIMEAYEKLGEACTEAGPLTDRERALVKIGLSVGARLEGGLHYHVRKDLEAMHVPAEISLDVLLTLPT